MFYSGCAGAASKVPSVIKCDYELRVNSDKSYFIAYRFKFPPRETQDQKELLFKTVIEHAKKLLEGKDIHAERFFVGEYSRGGIGGWLTSIVVWAGNWDTSMIQADIKKHYADLYKSLHEAKMPDTLKRKLIDSGKVDLNLQ